MKAVNLIPTEQRATAKPAVGPAAAAPQGNSPVGAYAIIGVLLFAVAASALYVLTGNSITENKAELQRVEQEASAVEAQASSLQSFADFHQISDARETTVRSLAATRFSWNRTLDDVSRALPADVFISSLDGATTSATAGSSLRGAILAPSIELLGCTDDQASVARLMSNLQEVRGVTRVSLAKSEAIDTPTTAAAAPAAPVEGEAAPQTTSEPCPPGSPPTFDVIVFFERAAVPAGASPNAGLTGVATGPTGPTGPTGAAGSSTTTSAMTP